MHDANGNIVDIDGNILDENGDKTGVKGGSPIIEDNWYKANSVDDSSEENWLDDKWVYVPDTNDGLYGYFYYTEPLKAGESTTDLINWVNTDRESVV